MIELWVTCNDEKNAANRRGKITMGLMAHWMTSRKVDLIETA